MRKQHREVLKTGLAPAHRVKNIKNGLKARLVPAQVVMNNRNSSRAGLEPAQAEATPAEHPMRERDTKTQPKGQNTFTIGQDSTLNQALQC